MILFVIPARGGSKRLPGKNIRPLGGKPLILHSVDFARKFAADADICVTTDDAAIRDVVIAHGLQVPFIRPAELATDTATTDAVLRHALQYYAEKQHKAYDKIVLLQPTSPFRKEDDLRNMLQIFEAGASDTEMVVSVTQVKKDIFGTLRTENNRSYLEPMPFPDDKACPLYQLNGSIYVISVPSLQDKTLSNLNNIRKYVMEDIYSGDIDTMMDWMLCETILNNGILEDKS